MNPEEIKLIEDNIDYIIDNTINVNNIIKYLLERCVLNSYMANEIEKIEDGQDKIRKLFKRLTRRGPAAFDHLLNVLVETDNENVLTHLLLRSQYYKYQNNKDIKPFLKVKVIKGQQRMDRVDIGSYEMGSRPKGLALIININRFMDTSPMSTNEELTRHGSYRDVANLYSLLSQLGYKVTLRYDLAYNGVMNELNSFLKKTDHKNVDSCVVVIMSHGEDGDSFRTYDNKYINCKDVLEKFKSTECPALHKKPKIFIFEMCRGHRIDKGYCPDQVYLSKHNSGAQLNAGVLGPSTTDPVSPQPSIPVPNDGDFLIIFPVGPGFSSKRDPLFGSWFVQNLCKVFMEHAHRFDLRRMMLEVKALGETEYDSEYGTQNPNLSDTGFKPLYFNPGLYNDAESNNTIVNRDFSNKPSD